MKRSYLIYLLILLSLLLLAPFVYAEDKHPCEEYVCTAQFNFSWPFGWGGSSTSEPEGATYFVLLPSSTDYVLLPSSTDKVKLPGH